MPLLTPEDYQRFPIVKPDKRYAYGSHPQQFGELTLPRTTPPHPVIALIHGGGYQEKYDIGPIGGVAKALADVGFAVWSIEYRRHGNGGSFPTMFLDVAAAADYLRHIAARHEIDLERTISMGHSAGGHLALWLAGRRNIERASPLFSESPLPIHAVLALAPLADPKRAILEGAGGEALLDVMGGHPASVPSHFRNGSPLELLPLDIPQAIIVGEEDADMLDNARGYVMAATALGDTAELLVLPQTGHFEIVAVETAAWIDVRRAALRLST